MMEQKSNRKQNEANLRKESISEATNLKSLKELIAGEPIKNYMKNEKPVIERYKAEVYKISDDLTTKENELHQIINFSVLYKIKNYLQLKTSVKCSDYKRRYSNDQRKNSKKRKKFFT